MGRAAGQSRGRAWPGRGGAGRGRSAGAGAGGACIAASYTCAASLGQYKCVHAGAACVSNHGAQAAGRAAPLTTPPPFPPASPTPQLHTQQCIPLSIRCHQQADCPAPAPRPPPLPPDPAPCPAATSPAPRPTTFTTLTTPRRPSSSCTCGASSSPTTLRTCCRGGCGVLDFRVSDSSMPLGASPGASACL